MTAETPQTFCDLLVRAKKELDAGGHKTSVVFASRWSDGRLDYGSYLWICPANFPGSKVIRVEHAGMLSWRPEVRNRWNPMKPPAVVRFANIDPTKPNVETLAINAAVVLERAGISVMFPIRLRPALNRILVQEQIYDQADEDQFYRELEEINEKYQAGLVARAYDDALEAIDMNLVRMEYDLIETGGFTYIEQERSDREQSEQRKAGNDEHDGNAESSPPRVGGFFNEQLPGNEEKPVGWVGDAG